MHELNTESLTDLHPTATWFIPPQQGRILTYTEIMRLEDLHGYITGRGQGGRSRRSRDFTLNKESCHAA